MRRLAAARLADEAERLAPAQRERDVVDGADLVAVLVEGLAQALDPDDGLGIRLDRALHAGGGRGAAQLGGLLPEMAPAAAPAAEVEERRLLAPADVLDQAAAVDEHACRQVRAELREQSGDGVEALAVLAHATARDAAQQPDGVGMARILEDRSDRALLDEPPGVEHADAVAHPRDDA